MYSLIQLFFITFIFVLFIGDPSLIFWEDIVAGATLGNFRNELCTLLMTFGRVIITYNRYAAFVLLVFVDSAVSSIHVVDRGFTLFWTINTQLFLECILIFSNRLTRIKATIIMCYIAISACSIIIIVWVLSCRDRWGVPILF